jgi:RNA polymerase sigma factor (TIGR02999 family)
VRYEELDSSAEEWSLSGASEQVSDLLRAWSGGNPKAAEQLMPLLYDELRGLAVRQLRGERGDHTLRPTALVHEAFLRMVDQKEGAWRNRAQFFALAAQAMRRVLVDHARTRRAAKRAGGWERVTLDEEAAVEGPQELDVLALNAALEELHAIDEGKVRLVELRFFGGLSVEEAAEVLGVSPSTLAREWRLVKAWLYRRLQDCCR